MYVPPGTRVVPGRVLVRFRAGVSLTARVAARSDISASVGVAYHLVPGLQLLDLPPGVSVASAVTALSADRSVEYAVPDLEVRVAATPNDPLYSSQWAPPAIGAPAAWNRTTGSASVIVAVLDTGADVAHPDLAANLVPGWNFLTNTSDVTDTFPHGTHVAGIIGAVGGNGIGVSGINWHVSLMPLKICDHFCSLGAEIQALQYAVDHGAKIANASFGASYGGDQPEEDAIAAAGQAGLLYVAAAGNNGLSNDATPFYPASYGLDNMISVAATTSSGGLLSTSDYGATSVLIGAPGDNILSTMPTSIYPSGYASDTGTSMAAPQVSGAAALLWAEHPDWTMQQVRMRLLTTASPLASLMGKVADCGQLNVGAATDPTVPDGAIVCVKVSGTGGGSVLSSPAAINCGTTCFASVPVGTTLTLSATPSVGSTFVGWGGACSGTGSCTVSASGIGDVTATFRTSGSPSGWQQKRLPSPAGRDPNLSGSDSSSTFYNVAVSADGSERAKTIFNPPHGPSPCYYDSTDTGGVFLEHRTAAGWVADGTVTAPSVPAYDGDGSARWANCFQFGTVTQLSADGTTLLVTAGRGITGDPDPPGIRYRCAAYVYQHGDGGWTLDTILYPPGFGPRGSGNSSDCGSFGTGGTVSADGARIAILASGLDASGTFVQRADIYTRSQGVWSLEQQLTLPSPNTSCGGLLPHSLSLSGDGTTLLAGNPGCNDSGVSFVGLVYAYARSGTQWTLAQTIQSPAPAASQRFGSNTALAQDGNTAVIGGQSGSGNAVWVFERDQTGWHMRARLRPPASSLSTIPFGCPTIVEGGARIICGAVNDTVGFNAEQGSIFIFDRPVAGWASAQPQAAKAFATDGLDSDQLGRNLTLAAPENGSFIDAPIWAAGFASGAYPHDRIGYEFTTGLIDKTLSLATVGEGSGSITSDPAGIDCGATCWHDYADSTSVTVTATPAVGSAFVGWAGDCSGTGPCTLAMNADHTVSASFTLPPETLTVSDVGNGSGSVTSSPEGIDCGSTCAHSFHSGTSVQLTATPATGSSFAGWTGGSCSGTGTCTVSMTQATSVAATFTISPETLTLFFPQFIGVGSGSVTSSPAGISCTLACSHDFNYGTTVQLTATPATGSSFTGWTGGGCSGTGSCTVSMTQQVTVSATFTRITPSLSVTKSGTGQGSITSTPSGISCGSTCSFHFDSGTSVQLTATPAIGSTFAGWTGGGCSGTSSCTVLMTQARNVTGTFTAQPPVTLRVSRSGLGTVSSSPSGISCGLTCSHTYAYGTAVTLTAGVPLGSVFVGWLGACTGTSKTCHVSMTAALATTARFAKTKRLTVVKAGTGGGTVKSGPTGITCGTTCTHVFVAGTVVTLTATAKSGSRFTGWSGACSGTGTCSVTMNAAKAVTATFTRASASRRFSRKTVQTLARFEELLQRIAKQLEQWAS